ncbi:uncharacterized protein [Aegilops tauschii subsp. strangulata]|uniref:uncharacterized protein n=1 Tax=Aegilops tauschii subsp. strangulata TaxID=200361 RepID=UPI003CC8612F
MDDFLNTTEYHPIVADGNTKLDVWYTNEPGKVEKIIGLYEDWLREEKHKARMECPALKDFLENRGITFSSVGVRNIRDALFQDFIRIPEGYHIDIQEKFMIKGDKERDSMEDLAGAIIDESYSKLESSFPELLRHYWDWKPLTFDHLKYGATISDDFIFEGYVSYELYRRFLSMRDILHRRCLPDLRWRGRF